MLKSDKISIVRNDNLTYTVINKECCIYLKDKKQAATLNATATCVFLFLQNSIENDCTTITFEEIINEIKSKFNIPDASLDFFENEVENLIFMFREIGLLVV